MTTDSFWLARDDRASALTLAVLGMMSGAVAWKLIDASDHLGLNFDVEWFVFLVLPISIFPGLVFGVVIGTLLWWRGRLNGARLIGYAIASCVGYFAAFHVAFHIITGLSDDKSVAGTIAGGVAAGLVGSLMLGWATMWLLRAKSRLALRLPVAIGTAFGALLAFVVDDGGEGLGWLAFFVLWQGGYAASLAPLLRPSEAATTAVVSGS